MLTLKDNVLMVTLSNKSDAFHIKDIATGKEAEVSYADCFGCTFKYQSNFDCKFAEQFGLVPATTTVLVPEEVAKKIDALIEFNRVDN